ncbi:MAG: tetratricopeptide repeat protein [Flavobacteriales bacterium]
MAIHHLLLISFILFAPMSSWSQDEEEGIEALPIQVWQCLAGWTTDDTMHYELLMLDRSYKGETITAKKESSTRIRVSVVDSSEAGYVLNWQWLISDPQEVLGLGLTDTNLIRSFKAMSILDMTVRTEPNGSLISVDDVDRSITGFIENFERFTQKYENELDSAMVSEILRTTAGFRQNKTALGAALIANIELFFSPYGYEVLSDSFYVSPYEIRNVINGELIPGTIRVELKDVNEFNYHVEAIFDPNSEELMEQMRETLNKQQKANRAKRYSMKDIRAFSLQVKREEHFVMQTASGWPKNIHSVVRSGASGERREVERTVTDNVYIGKQKNELYYDGRITSNPSDPLNYIERADIRLERGDLAGAEEDLTMAYELDPAVSTLRRRAWVRSEQLKYEEALEDADAALKDDSMNVYSLNLRTHALFSLHRYSEALASAERSMRILPNAVNSMRQAGKSLVALYRYPEAIEVYTDFLARDTSDWTTYGLRADAYAYLRTAEGDSLAELDIQRSLSIKPDNYSAMLTLGNMYLERGKFEHAVAVYDTILAHGTDMTVLHNRGYAKVKMGALDDGIKDLEDALDLEPGHAFGPNNLGWAYHLRGEHAKALQWIDKGIARQPTNSFAFYNKGRVLLARGQVDEACGALHEAERLGFSKGYGAAVQELMDKHCSP